MKRMRAIIVMLLALALVVGCAHSTEKGATTPAGPSLQRILQKGELVVGTAAEMPPLMMKNKQGKVIGMEADLAAQMASIMGVKLRFEIMQFSKLISALEQGKVDMILSYMTITSNRNLKVAFVGPYFISGKAFLTKIETIANATEATQVNSPGTRLTALKGSTSEAFVEAVLPKVQYMPAKNYKEGVDMVIKGKAHALIADYPVCVVSVFRYPNKGLLSVVTPLTYEPLGIAVPANDPHLINWVENFLNNLEGSGNLEALRDQWFGDTSWMSELP